jgi:hypothetical protein
MCTPSIEKKLYMCLPAIEFLTPDLIRSEHMKSCLAAQIRFMLFKGLGSFKNFFKIGGYVDELKAYRLIPLTPHLLFHFTQPLNCEYLREVSKISKWVSGAARRWFKKKSHGTVLLSCQKWLLLSKKISKNVKNKVSMFQIT